MTKFSPGNKWAAKLSNEDVFTIRSRYAAGGVTQMQLALDYHVSLNTIRYAIKGVTHQNVGMVETEDEVFSKAQESERVFRMMLETEELSPEPEPPPTPDPFAKMLSRAEPLEVSMARIRDAEAREHAERMSKLNELKTQDTQTHEHESEAKILHPPLP
jgi:hypothetical protein